MRLVANPHYWRAGQPVSHEVVITVFSDMEAASAALQSGGVDLIYGAGSRAAVRLRDAGFQLIQDRRRQGGLTNNYAAWSAATGAPAVRLDDIDDRAATLKVVLRGSAR